MMLRVELRRGVVRVPGCRAAVLAARMEGTRAQLGVLWARGGVRPWRSWALVQMRVHLHVCRPFDQTGYSDISGIMVRNIRIKPVGVAH